MRFFNNIFLVLIIFFLTPNALCLCQSVKVKYQYDHVDTCMNEVSDDWFLNEPFYVKKTDKRFFRVVSGGGKVGGRSSKGFSKNTPKGPPRFFFDLESLKNDSYQVTPHKYVNNENQHNHLRESSYFFGVKAHGLGLNGHVIYYLMKRKNDEIEIDLAFGVTTLDSLGEYGPSFRPSVQNELSIHQNGNNNCSHFGLIDSNFFTQTLQYEEQYIIYEQPINEIIYSFTLSNLKNLFEQKGSLTLTPSTMNELANRCHEIANSGFSYFEHPPTVDMLSQSSIYNRVYLSVFQDSLNAKLRERAGVDTLSSFSEEYELLNYKIEPFQASTDESYFCLSRSKGPLGMTYKLFDNSYFQVGGTQGVMRNGKLSGPGRMFLNRQTTFVTNASNDHIAFSQNAIVGTFKENEINGPFEIINGDIVYRGAFVNGKKEGTHIIVESNNTRFIGNYDNGVLMDTIIHFSYDQRLPKLHHEIAPLYKSEHSVSNSFLPKKVVESANLLKGRRVKNVNPRNFLAQESAASYTLATAYYYEIDLSGRKMTMFFPNRPIKKIVADDYSIANGSYQPKGTIYLHNDFGTARVVKTNFESDCLWDNVVSYVFRDKTHGEITQSTDQFGCNAFVAKMPETQTSFQFPKDVFNNFGENMWNRIAEDVGKFFKSLNDEVCKASGADNCTFNYYIGTNINAEGDWTFSDKSGRQIQRPNHQFKNYDFISPDIDDIDFSYGLNDMKFLSNLMNSYTEFDLWDPEDIRQFSIEDSGVEDIAEQEENILLLSDPVSEANLIKVDEIKNVLFNSLEKYIGEFPIFGSPTLAGIVRNDRDGLGTTFASRLDRFHLATDFLAYPGESIFSTITGEVIDIRAVTSRSGVLIHEVMSVSIRQEDGVIVRTFYVNPTVKKGDLIKKGSKIGTAVNMKDILYPHSRHMQNHVHLEYLRNKQSGCYVTSPDGIYQVKVKREGRISVCEIGAN